MSLADLQNFDNFDAWMRAVSEAIGLSLLFVTKPTSGGSADAGPFIRLKPTQVVGYEILTASRHTASDGDLGKGASHDLIRGASANLDGIAELFATISGTTGIAQADTNMRYIQDAVDGVSPQIDVEHNSDTGISADNTYPGIWTVVVSNTPLDEPPVVEIEAHTHEDNDEGGTLGQNMLGLDEQSFALTLPGSSTADIEMTINHCFFPMASCSRYVEFMAATNDGESADLPRIALHEWGGFGSESFDFDICGITL